MDATIVDCSANKLLVWMLRAHFWSIAHLCDPITVRIKICNSLHPACSFLLHDYVCDLSIRTLGYFDSFHFLIRWCGLALLPLVPFAPQTIWIFVHCRFVLGQRFFLLSFQKCNTRSYGIYTKWLSFRSNRSNSNRFLPGKSSDFRLQRTTRPLH